ncbi:hypothetical protein Tco_1524328 [Tanacetum coccineum]
MFGLKLKSCGLTKLVGIIVFGKLSAIKGFFDSLPIAVCSGIANSFLLFRHCELITIFGAVVKPSLDELSALWLSCSWICDALAVRQGDSSFFCSDFTWKSKLYIQLTAVGQHVSGCTKGLAHSGMMVVFVDSDSE